MTALDRLTAHVTPDGACRACGAHVELLRNVPVSEAYSDGYPRRDRPLPRRTRTAGTVIACTGCELVEEVR